MRTREIKKGAKVVVVKRYGLTSCLGQRGVIISKQLNNDIVIVSLEDGFIHGFRQGRLHLIKDSREKKNYRKLEMKFNKPLISKKEVDVVSEISKRAGNQLGKKYDKENLSNFSIGFKKSKKDSRNGYKLPLAMKEAINKHVDEWKNTIQPMLLITLKIEEKQQTKKKTSWSFWFIVLEVLVLLGLIIYFW